MRSHTFLFSALVLIPLIGAGCSPDSPVSLDKYQTPTETPSAPPTPPAPPVAPPLPTEDTATGSHNTTITTTTRPLASSTTMNPNTMEPPAFPGILPSAQTRNRQIRIKTSKGDIVFDLLPKEGPLAASNFVYLVRRKFYDGLTFHRAEPEFVIAGGDPRDGTGDPGTSSTMIPLVFRMRLALSQWRIPPEFERFPVFIIR